MPEGVTPIQQSAETQGINFQLPGQETQVVNEGILANLQSSAQNLVNFQNTGTINGEEKKADPNNFLNIFGIFRR